ncbi:MAG: ExbD/TolR family protein [Planctomycetota bacterium]|jgi:biopolymer transport protein ExbD
MRTPSNLARGGLGFNMTPMIDVVFLLIIFFLVSSHLARQEVQLDLDLPEAVTGQPTAEDEARRVVVNVLSEARRQGQIQLGGEVMDSRRLAEVIGEENTKARSDKEGLEVRIRTDRLVPYAVIEPILLACWRAGVWNVTFAVVSNE